MMNKFTFNCPECGNSLEAENSWCGQKTFCPYCSKEILIPFPAAVPKVKAVVKGTIPERKESFPQTTQFQPQTQPKPPREPMKRSTKIGIIAGSIGAFLILLLIASVITYNWYRNEYLPRKANEGIAKVIREFQLQSSRELRITMLKDGIAKYPLADLTRARELLAAEEKLYQRELWEKKKQSDYQNALNKDREKNIFIVRKGSGLPGGRYYLFRVSQEFVTVLGKYFRCQNRKMELAKAMASLVRQYKGKEKTLPFKASQIDSLIFWAGEADKELPALRKELVRKGAPLLVKYEKISHKFNTFFSRIPSGMWHILGELDNGEIIGNGVIKMDGIPVFLEYNKKGLKLATKQYANKKELLLIAKKEEELRKEEQRKKEERKKARIAAIKKALADIGKKSRLSPDPAKVDPEGSVESFLNGLIFFAKLRENSKAYGGKWRRKLKPSFLENRSVKGINFSGLSKQGIRYKLKNVLDGEQPRSVSFWYYCTGYSSEKWNTVFSCLGKNYDKYFRIEFDKNNDLFAAWGPPRKILHVGSKADIFRWHHVVVTYDGRRMHCYFNGKKYNALLLRDGFKTPAASIMIGTRPDDNGHNFHGSLRNVAMYNRALSAKEILILNKYGLKEDN